MADIRFCAFITLCVTTSCGGRSQLDQVSGVPITPTPEVKVINQCPKTAYLQFTDEVANTPAANVPVAKGETVSHKRKKNGELTVWLVNEDGRGRAHVIVSHQMDHVKITDDCFGLKGT